MFELEINTQMVENEQLQESRKSTEVQPKPFGVVDQFFFSSLKVTVSPSPVPYIRA